MGRGSTRGRARSERSTRFVGVATALLASCSAPTERPDLQTGPDGGTTVRVDATNASATAPPQAAVPPRPTLDGKAFPDKVLSLTWDDGPDSATLQLASFLSAQGVHGTFFVVGEWVRGVSDEPGYGKDIEASGHTQVKVLPDLVALGHRVANHTFDHVLLHRAPSAFLREQLGDNQRAIDPYITNELRLFRAPGGAFSDAASSALDAEPDLRSLVGPVGWDIDRKDWDASVACRSERPALECEHAGPDGTLRVKPAVVAQRYLESIDYRGHGIVLFHDRVGHRGSTFALDVARHLIPQLRARHYVFAAPVLAFSPMRVRLVDEEDDARDPPLLRDLDPGSLRIADIDGDGREDVCGRSAASALSCALSSNHLTRGEGAMFRRTAITGPALGAYDGRIVAETGARAGLVDFADVDGDGRADLCVRGGAGIACAVATAQGFGTLQPWSATRARPYERIADFSDAEGWSSAEAYARTVRFADIDGDGRADVCGRGPSGVVCARSLGHAFDHERTWLPELSDARGWLAAPYAATMMLGDVNGDGVADVCARGRDGLACALSKKTGFGKLERWSSGADFADGGEIAWASDPSYYGTLRLGDINGDGRADVCGRGPSGVVCAFSTGIGFTRATLWDTALSDAAGFRSDLASAIQLGDINGDGRADLCARDGRGIICALAP